MLDNITTALDPFEILFALYLSSRNVKITILQLFTLMVYKAKEDIVPLGIKMLEILPVMHIQFQ